MKKLLLFVIGTMLTFSAYGQSNLPPCNDTDNKNWNACIGSIVSSNGDIYFGEFSKGIPNGQGRYEYANGAKYFGEIKSGKRHGRGISIYSDGDRYTGDYKDNNRNGKGTLIYSNGDKYVGEFKDELKHGDGILFYIDGSVPLQGEWKYARFVRSAHVNLQSAANYFQIENQFKYLMNDIVVQKKEPVIEEKKAVATEQQLAIEIKKLEQEKIIIEERKKLVEEKRKLEEDQKQVEIDSIRRQKELMALQEERRQIEQKQLDNLQEDKVRQEKLAVAQAEAKAKAGEERAKKEQERLLAEEAKVREQAELREAVERKRAAELAKVEEEKRKKDAEAAALAEKRKQQEEQGRLALEMKKAEEEERKKLEAYKKTPPVISVTQSEPDEFGVILLEISISKPTKSLLIDGDSEGPSSDGKYRVKRVLKKTGKSTFTIVATDEFGGSSSIKFGSELKRSDSSLDLNRKVSTNVCWSTIPTCTESELIERSNQNEPSTVYIFNGPGSCLYKSFAGGTIITNVPISCTLADSSLELVINSCKTTHKVDKTNQTKNNKIRIQTTKQENCSDFARSLFERDKGSWEEYFVFNLTENRNEVSQDSDPSSISTATISKSNDRESAHSPNSKDNVNLKNDSIQKSLASINDPVAYVSEKRWSISESLPCSKENYLIYSPRIPSGVLAIIGKPGDFKQLNEHKFTKISNSRFQLEVKEYSDGNPFFLSLAKYNRNVITGELHETVELIAPNRLKVTRQMRSIDLDESMKNGKVSYEKPNTETSIRNLCNNDEVEADAKNFVESLLPKIEDGKSYRSELAERSKIRTLFACGESGLPLSVAKSRVKNILSFFSPNFPDSAFSDLLRSHKCISFSNPLPPDLLNRASFVKKVGERKYYVIESDASFVFGGVL